jgi:hypothetical protein
MTAVRRKDLLCIPGFVHKWLMMKSMKSQNSTTDLIWLRLPGYRAVSLKPEFDAQAMELERAIHRGVPAYPDSDRPDFYDVELDGGWTYVHIYREARAVYLVCPLEMTRGMAENPELENNSDQRSIGRRNIGSESEQNFRHRVLDAACRMA